MPTRGEACFLTLRCHTVTKHLAPDRQACLEMSKKGSSDAKISTKLDLFWSVEWKFAAHEASQICLNTKEREYVIGGRLEAKRNGWNQFPTAVTHPIWSNLDKTAVSGLPGHRSPKSHFDDPPWNLILHGCGSKKKLRLGKKMALWADFGPFGPHIYAKWPKRATWRPLIKKSHFNDPP